jgi:hypothetical protein
MGIVLVACCAALNRRRRRRHDHVDIKPNQFAREGREAIKLALRPPLLQEDGPSLHIAQSAQALPKCVGENRADRGRVDPQDADARDLCSLLCPGH